MSTTSTGDDNVEVELKNILIKVYIDIRNFVV